MPIDVRNRIKRESLQRVSQGADTFSPVRDAKVPQSRVSQVLDTINQVLPGVATQATTDLKKFIEADKLKQENRKLAGLAPTDDATKAGIKAHGLVDTRNTANDYARRMQQFADTFTGTDEEYEQGLEELQSQMFDDIGGKTDTNVEVAGEMLREQLPKVADIRMKAKAKMLQLAQYDSVQTSLREAVSGDFTPEQIRQNLSFVFEESEFMGASGEVVRKALVDEAVTQAENNDLTLMDFTKELGIFGQEAKLIRADRQATSRITAEDADAVAIQKQDLITQLKESDNMDFEEFAKRAGAQKSIVGDSVWTESEIRSTWKSVQAAKDKEWDSTEYFNVSMRRVLDPNAMPVSFLPMDKKKQRAVIAKYDSVFTPMLAARIAQTQDPKEQIAIKEQFDKAKAKYLADNGMIDENWKSQFEALERFDGQAADFTKLPEGVSVAVARMDALATMPGSLQAHATTKQISIYENFKAGLAAGLTPTQSYSEGWRQANNPPVRLIGEERKFFDSQVRREVESTFEHGFFAQTFLGETESIGQQQKEQYQQQIGKRAMQLMQGNVPQDAAINRAIAEFQDTHTQIDNGMVVYGKRSWIAQKMGVRADAVDSAIAGFPAKIAELADEPGFEDVIVNTDALPEDWLPQITSNGLISFVDQYGTAVTRPFTLGEVGGYSLKQQIEETNKKTKELNEERKKNLETRKRTINQFGLGMTRYASPEG